MSGELILCYVFCDTSYEHSGAGIHRAKSDLGESRNRHQLKKSTSRELAAQ